MWKKLMMITILLFCGNNVLADSCPDEKGFIMVHRDYLPEYWDLSTELKNKWTVEKNVGEEHILSTYHAPKVFSPAWELKVMVAPGSNLSNADFRLSDSSVLCVYGTDNFPPEGIIGLTLKELINPGQKYSLSSNFYPSTKTQGAYECTTTVGNSAECQW